MAFNTSEGPGPCGDSYTESTSKALMPQGLRVDINAALLACPPPPKARSSEEAGVGGALFPGSPLPTKVLGPNAGKECLLKD